ncbi:esterase/lipase family protein [Rhodococcus artemisiae]|uniref:esterase/lipase family protein n=1 Tax=Rhodococcus artemisiae TaxID=714159 RepID=UPI0038B50C03
MRRHRSVGAALVGALCTLALVAGPVGAQPAGSSTAFVPVTPGPIMHTHAEAAEYADTHRGAAPTGTNDFTCRPSNEHPKPVILAHGTDSNSYSDFAALAPLLVESGWCVFVLNYGLAAGDEEYGTGDIRVSAAQLGGFVDTVRAATGADEVDLLGYSQGATVARYYINELGGDDVVDRWVGVASPSYGGTFYGLGAAAALVPGALEIAEESFSVALVQQLEGSELLEQLNTPTDTVPGVRYTTIGTNVDEVIQPAGNVALRSGDAVNYEIQDLCPQDLTGHFNMVYDPFALSLMRHALDPDRYGLGDCVPVALGTGIPEMIIQSNF